MRHRVRNLSKRNSGDAYGKWVAGSWNGLRGEMVRFFQQAPIHSQLVLEEQRESLQRARAREEGGTAAAMKPSQQLQGSTPVSAPHHSNTGNPGVFYINDVLKKCCYATVLVRFYIHRCSIN